MKKRLDICHGCPDLCHDNSAHGQAHDLYRCAWDHEWYTTQAEYEGFPVPQDCVRFMEYVVLCQDQPE
jgi:hypothetical protein